MNQQHAINNRQLTKVNNKAFDDDMVPAGISLTAVRGFFASKFLSSHRLKAMAALRAKIIQSTTRIKMW